MSRVLGVGGSAPHFRVLFNTVFREFPGIGELFIFEESAMSAILKVLDAEISKYESLVRQLKASRAAIAAAESGAGAPAAKGRVSSAGTSAKRRGRPPKNGGAKGGKSAPSPTGRKRGRPPKKAVDAPAELPAA
jgi:hypothetical protein